MEREKSGINNAFYEELKEEWYEREDHPIALLRAENALRNPWISDVISLKLGKGMRVLDVGCGGGFLTHFLALEGHAVHGVDLSNSSLESARERDKTRSVFYQEANAVALPYEDGCMDVVCAMDLLEHLERPLEAVLEASRLLRKGGLFFFHTFNRNFLSWLVVIKGVEWCVRNAPKNMHVYPLFLKPAELKQMCHRGGLEVQQFRGVRPVFGNVAFWKMVFTRKVEKGFEFVFSESLCTGYSGYAIKL